MANSSLFNAVHKSRQARLQAEEHAQLQLIAENQRAAHLVRLFEEGRMHEVQKMAAANLQANFLGRLFEKRQVLALRQLAAVC